MKHPVKTDTKKKQCLAALEKSLGIVTDACKTMKIHRSTFYDWYKADKEFAEAADSINDLALDFAESQLFERIRSGDTTATIFYLKTKGKKRGYVERQEIID